MRAAYHHWPEQHANQFSSAEELRKWVQMKAGHREISARIPLTGVRKEIAEMLAAASIRAVGEYAVPLVHGSELIIWKPKSIAFATLGHKAFCDLNNEIDDVLKAEIGLTGDQLLQHSEAAA